MQNASHLSTSSFGSESSFYCYLAYMPQVRCYKNKYYFFEKRDYRLPQIEIDVKDIREFDEISKDHICIKIMEQNR